MKALHSYPVVYDGDTLERLIEGMPRKPTAFLARVADIEHKRAVAAAVKQRRLKAKARYLKRYRKRAAIARGAP